MLIATSSSNTVIKHYLSFLPDKPTQLRLTFIPTAAEVEPGDKQWLSDDRQTLVDAGFQVSDFTFTGATTVQVEKMLGTSDVIFVAGGNVFFLLQEMRKSGFTELITTAVQNGLIYIGSSAGSVVAGPDISMAQGLDDPALAPELSDYRGLGLTDLIIFPHWASPQFQHRYEKIMNFGYKMGSKIILLTDEQYLLVKGKEYTIESI